MARNFPGGTGTYLRVTAPHTHLDFGGTALTAMAWIRPDSSIIGDMIFGKEDGSGLSWDFFIESSILTARIREASGTDSVTGASTISTITWSHVAMRKNGTGANAFQVYVNGLLDGQITSNHSFDGSSNDFYIGARGQDDSNWDGWLCEVAVWDLALTPTEILNISRGTSPLTVQAANLRGYWPICGGVSPESDFSGNNKHALVVGSSPTAPHPLNNSLCGVLPFAPPSHVGGKGAA